MEERMLWKTEEKTMILWLSNPLREYFGKKKLIIGKTKREMEASQPFSERWDACWAERKLRTR